MFHKTTATLIIAAAGLLSLAGCSKSDDRVEQAALAETPEATTSDVTSPAVAETAGAKEADGPPAEILGIKLGDSAADAQNRLEAIDPTMTVIPTVVEQQAANSTKLPGVLFLLQAQTEDRVGKPKEQITVLMSGPPGPPHVVAISRKWYAPAHEPISWSQMLGSLDAKYGKHADIPGGRGQQWFLGGTSRAVERPASAAPCGWQGDFSGAYRNRLDNGGSQGMSDEQLTEWTKIDPRCGRVFQVYGYGVTDLKTAFDVVLIDPAGFNKSIRDMTAFMNNRADQAQAQQEQAAKERGLPPQ